jgi:hypothetical protein
MRGITMKTINNPVNPDRPLPKIFEGIQLGDRPEVIHNRFCGDSAELPPDAVAVYDVIVGAEILEDYPRMRAGLDWFRKYFPAEYMVLLD